MYSGTCTATLGDAPDSDFDITGIRPATSHTGICWLPNSDHNYCCNIWCVMLCGLLGTLSLCPATGASSGNIFRARGALRSRPSTCQTSSRLVFRPPVWRIQI